MRRELLVAVILVTALHAGVASALAAPPQVVATNPASNAMAPSTTTISITFDLPLLPSSVTASNLRVFGKQTGRKTGPITFSDANKTVTMTPSEAFAAGETVLVNLGNTIRGADSTPIRSAGWAFQFLIQTQPAARLFDLIQTQSNKTGAQTRIYGASAADLDDDGWIDLTTVNEVSADLRVFMNRGDGSGTYKPILRPPFPIGVEASPNETGDFNNDGKMDLAVSATIGGGVWVVRGAGNGTWSGSQVVPTGDSPHGVAVLDVDGDADLDIVDALAGDNRMALLLNNGAGVFSSPTYFEGGCNGEWGLASGDLNSDGIIDLVVGCVGDARIAAMLGNGDATFTVLPSQGAGGSPWQLALGDVDGDGDLDLTAANAFPPDGKGGALLIGNGDGTFGAPTRFDTAGHTPATDLGDMDGDGDLDWVLSGFVGGLWKLYVNDGAGTFTFDQEFAATANPSCAVLLDVDNDGDLDMGLTDEIDDTLSILQNISGPSPLCPAAPEACRGSAIGGKSSLTIKNRSPDKGDHLVWKWAAGLATPKAEYGDPLGSDDYAICVYDAGELVTSVTADGGGICAGKPCWVEKPTSFLYKDKELTPTGAQALHLVEGLTDGKARITLKAKGVPLAMPNLSLLDGPIDVQLHRSGGVPCFGSTFSPPFSKNDGLTFKDRAD